MRPFQLKILFLLGVILFSITLNAQFRQKLSYDFTNTYKKKKIKNDLQLIFPLSLSSYYFEGFDSSFPPPGWQVIDALDSVNTWRSSAYADLPDAFEGANSAHCQYAVPGPSGEDWLISPKFSVSSGDSLSFEFKLEYFGYFPDSTFILISTTDSALGSFNHILDIYAEGLNYPTDVNWHYKTYSLKQFEGKDIYIAFKNKNTLGDGIFIDNVELGTRPAAQAAVIKIEIPDFYPAGSSKPKALIKNKGSIAQTIKSMMLISGGYSSTKTTKLNPQEGQLVEFDTWDATIGNYTIDVQTFLLNDTITSDDKLSIKTKVLAPFTNFGWSTHEALINATVGAACASDNNNINAKIFSIGGVINSNSFTTDVYEYDQSFLTWSSINPIPVATWQSAASASNGKIVVTGGESSTGVVASTQVYNQLTTKWSIAAPMPSATANMAFGTYKDSLLYIIGGRKSDGSFTNSVQIYDLFNNKWTNGTSKPGAQVSGLSGGISGNKIIVTGGFDNLSLSPVNTSYIGIINPQKPTEIEWSQTDDYPLDKIRFLGSGVSLDNNSNMVVFSGGTYTDNFSDVTNHTFAYDFNDNTWKLGPNKPTKSHFFNMTPIIENDTVYLAAIGGGDGNFQIDKNEWLNLGYYKLPTATNEVKILKIINLSPNPFSNQLQLKLDLQNAGGININLIDVLGKIVYTQNYSHMHAGETSIYLNTEKITNGIYFCVIDMNGTRIGKVVSKI